ncbi:uncharacterized protein TNCV_2578561 [Trichonephila clavipes]|nr:uncharacterized protein TNCV_2578561 [Trichonephila clavipes]
MEAVGAFRIFERPLIKRDLQYTEYYGDGDSKGFLQVKDIYGENSVTKLECIGHIQKRVGSRLRKLKKNTKGLGRKGKLTDKFIDKLQNYYGIAIRSNVGCPEKMQSAVITAFFHCCSSNKYPMHGQCQTGKGSWCKYKQALCDGKVYVHKTTGLSNLVIKVIKPTYLALFNKELLKRGLHGKTQNNNESFNNVLWSILPKEIFVHKKTLFLGSYMAVILYNLGYLGLLPVFNYLGIGIDPTTLKNYMGIDTERIQKSKRQSLPSTKLSRKKTKSQKKSKLAKHEAKEGLSYKYERVLDWFEVLGYRVVEVKATDYAHLKQALSEQFPVVRNRSELETRFYSSSQKDNQKPSDFVYDLLKIYKILKLEMMEEKLIDHIISRLEPTILDYVEVRHPHTTSNLLQIIDKYEERFLNRKIRGSSWESRDIKPSENNRFPNRNRQENWRETRGNSRYVDNSRPRREYNRFESQGVVDNQRFDGRRRGGQSDHRFHNQGGSRNSTFRSQNDRKKYLNL